MKKYERKREIINCGAFIAPDNMLFFSPLIWSYGFIENFVRNLKVVGAFCNPLLSIVLFFMFYGN